MIGSDSYLQKAISDALLLFVATGVVQTKSIYDVPNYAFIVSVVLQLIGLCAGVLLLGRAILRH